MAERSKARECDLSLAGIAGSNSARVMDLSLVRVVCCQIEVSAMGRSLVQRSPADCSVMVCDLETSRIRRPRSALGCCSRKKEVFGLCKLSDSQYSSNQTSGKNLKISHDSLFTHSSQVIFHYRQIIRCKA